MLALSALAPAGYVSGENAMRSILTAILATTALCLGGPALAGGSGAVVGVVEMFTSQGCSSCPAADRILLDLAGDRQLIALGYHVDYWDFRGWKDTLARREFTERQSGYARAFDSLSVYTPQAVINGRRHVKGSDRSAIREAISELNRAGNGLAVDVRLTEAGNNIVIEAGSGDAGGREAHLVLVFFDEATEVTIARGENRGRSITYANVVTGMRTAGVWHGETVRFELPRSEVVRQGSGGCAVLLQVVNDDEVPGEILGAALLRTP